MTEKPHFYLLTFILDGQSARLSRILENETNEKNDASMGAVALTPAGAIIEKYWNNLHAHNPALAASARVVMPNHCHLLLIVNQTLDATFDIDEWIDSFCRQIEQAWAAMGADAQDLKWAEVQRREIAANDGRLLASVRRYIHLNPAREQWRLRHPDKLTPQLPLRHPILPTESEWSGVGDLTILSSPFLVSVRLSSDRALECQEECISNWVNKAKQGCVIVSNFSSSAEIELWNRLIKTPRTRFIKLLPYALPEGIVETTLETSLLRENRMLILSGFPHFKGKYGGEYLNNRARMMYLARKMCSYKNGLPWVGDC